MSVHLGATNGRDFCRVVRAQISWATVKLIPRLGRQRHPLGSGHGCPHAASQLLVLLVPGDRLVVCRSIVGAPETGVSSVVMDVGEAGPFAVASTWWRIIYDGPWVRVTG